MSRQTLRWSLINAADLEDRDIGLHRCDSTDTSARDSCGSQAEREWLRLQARLTDDQQIARDTELAIQSLGENSGQFMNTDELRDSVMAKEAMAEELRQEALDTQSKFIWELSLAIKRCLVSEAGPTTLRGVAISQIPVQAVLDDAESEDPQPHEWLTWAERRFAL